MTSNQKRRAKRQLKRTLRKFGACLFCGPLLGRTLPEGVPIAHVKCEGCGADLWLEVNADSAEAKEALRRYARSVAVKRQIPASLYDVRLDDGRELLSDPHPVECCPEDDPCVDHLRLEITLDTSAPDQTE